MALKSMTGFGEGKATSDGVHVTVEVSSVNRKQLDVNMGLPRNLIALDARIQSRVRQEFTRGRVSGIVRVEVAEGYGGTVRIDARLAAQYVTGIRSVAKKLKLTDDLGAETIARLPGLVSVEQERLDAEHVWAVVDKAMDKALRGLAKMRRAEGRTLEADLRERMARLEERVKNIRNQSGDGVKSYREKLHARLRDTGLDDLASDERVVKEIALFADRCDISEELTRLKSHLGQARRLLRSVEPIGRTLDFLCQELFREINTISSKANGVEITRQVVAFKTELERIREQVQNIE
jgi:uncharacterized protein (TIGR00255 family)